MPDRVVFERARREIGYFAEALTGEPLWPHQLAVAQCPARIRCMLTGRQAGKSRTLAMLASWEAFRRPNARVLLISATDDDAKDLLAEVSLLASSPLLTGSVVDDAKSQLVLTNGSTVRSIPASMKQARGKSIDLLILDEACFIDGEVWKAARYTTIARPESRIVMASTPWGAADRFFAVNYREGLTPGSGFESFHWPSTVSPLVDEELLAMWRRTATDREYRAEVLAEWVDDVGAYFRADELERAAGEVYDLVTIEDAAEAVEDCTLGVDWGFAFDASTQVALAFDPSDGALWVPHLVEKFKTPYETFIEDVLTTIEAFDVRRAISETNGVGQMPTQVLESRLRDWGLAGQCAVEGVTTTAKLKEDAFGAMKILIGSDLLKLPQHPGLLRQLAALEYEQRESGALAIAVPERAGHDDLAMGLCLAVHGDPRVPVGINPGRRRVVDTWSA